jgi:hypothetical protein
LQALAVLTYVYSTKKRNEVELIKNYKRFFSKHSVAEGSLHRQCQQSRAAGYFWPKNVGSGLPVRISNLLKGMAHEKKMG